MKKGKGEVVWSGSKIDIRNLPLRRNKNVFVKIVQIKQKNMQILHK